MIHLQINIARSAFQLNLDIQLPGQGITAIFGPSGSGKTTIVHHLLMQPELNLDFSISATSRD